MQSNADDDEPTYRNLPIPSLSSGGASGAGFRELPVGFGGFGDGRPSFAAFATSSTGGYSEEQTVYRSLAVAPPSLALQRGTSAAAAKPAPLPAHQQHAFHGLPKVQFRYPEAGGGTAAQARGGGAAAAQAAGGGQPIPQPHPFYLEPNCFFIVRGEVKELVSVVDEVLAGKDSTFKAGKCKWKARSYVRNSCLDFRVVLFQGDWGPGLHVLEFQRRQGCAFQFAALVRKARAVFVRGGLVCDESGNAEAPPPTSARPPTSPRDTGCFPPSCSSLPKPTLTKAVLTPIVQLASSEYADMQCQAVREIANLAEDAEARAVLLTFGGLVERLAQCAQSADPGLHRCAAAALSSLALQDDCHDAVGANIDCLLRLAACCEGEGQWAELETQRQAAQCVLRLCEGSSACKGAVASKARPVFEGLKASADEGLRCCAESACEALQAAVC